GVEPVERFATFETATARPPQGEAVFLLPSSIHPRQREWPSLTPHAEERPSFETAAARPPQDEEKREWPFPPPHAEVAAQRPSRSTNHQARSTKHARPPSRPT